MPLPEQGDFLRRVKRVVRGVESSAEVLLYGSRARGEARAMSDWDFLILLDGPVDRVREGRVRRALYDLELETEQLISSIIRSRAEWNDPEVRTPFQANVRREGIAL